MKVFDKLIRVSKESFNRKLFKEDGIPLDESKLSRKERKKLENVLPTEDEKDFAVVYRSRIPQLARLQRKMSVCLLTEVTELEDDRVSFVYGKDTYTLTDPPNAFKICQALEKSTLDALAEMAAAGAVLKNGLPVENARNGSFKVDELRLLVDVADRFFFQMFFH